MRVSLLVPDVLPQPPSNHLIASLPRADRVALEGIMHRERLPRGQSLPSDDGNVWFPDDCTAGLCVTDEDGQTAQTGIVGPEGCVGLDALLDDAPPLADATVQIPGMFSVIPARKLRSVMRNRPVIRSALVRYLYRLTTQSLRVAACNRLHPLEKRCCTWLLMMQDRTHRDSLPVTQDALVLVLGGGRPRVNRTLGALERQGLIERRRGKIHLLRRDGLEQNACSCYQTIFRL